MTERQAIRIRVEEMDVKIVSTGSRIGVMLRNALYRSAHRTKVRLTITETEYSNYQHSKCGLVVVAYDLNKESARNERELYQLKLILECGDIDAPEVLLAVNSSDVPKESYERWVEAISRIYPILPFDIEKEGRVLDTALQPEILLCVS